MASSELELDLSSIDVEQLLFADPTQLVDDLHLLHDFSVDELIWQTEIEENNFHNKSTSNPLETHHPVDTDSHLWPTASPPSSSSALVSVSPSSSSSSSVSVSPPSSSSSSVSVSPPSSSWSSTWKDELSSKDRRCRVCLEAEAAKYLLYNGRVCNSCKAFFKRAVDSKGYQSFRCLGNGQCAIDSKSWTSCKWCRFCRCLVTAKMCVSMVSNEKVRVPSSRRSACNTSTRSKLKSSSSTSTSLTSCFLPELSSSVEPLVKTCVEVFRSTSLDAISLLNYHIPLCEIILKFWKDVQRPLTGYEHQCMDQWNREYFHMSFRNVDNLLNTRINAHDVRVLKRANLESVLAFGLTHVLGEEGLVFNQHDLEMMDVNCETWKAHLQPVTLNPRIVEINGRLRQNFQLLNYDTLFQSPWLPSLELEQRHRDLSMRMHKWGFELGDPRVFLLRRDIVVSTLMAMIIFFNPRAATGLKNPELVAKTHQCYLDAFIRYLRTLYPDDPQTVMQVFNGAMDVTELAREAAHIKEQKLII